jgi:3-deoxy-7-phosphoheptulonate synthase
LIAEYADILQVGARSMENYALLEALGVCGRPVLLKRGFTASLHDLLRSAQVIAECGNRDILLCERGIRTFETATRNTLDIAGVVVLKTVSHLPVIVDPSHAAGYRCLVPALSRIAVAAMADGQLVEVHPDPDHALSDGPQSLSCEQFEQMMADLEPYIALRAEIEAKSECVAAMGGRN